MKTINIFSKAAIFLMVAAGFFSAVSCSDNVYAQGTEKATNVKELLNDKSFVFEARTMIPTGGSSRPLNAYYDLKVRPEAVESFLPYFGRAYVAPMDPSAGPLRFTSKDFTYVVTETRKGWDVVIVPKDVREVQRMTLNIFENGSTTLQVTSTNRQPISFYGFITERKPKNEQ